MKDRSDLDPFLRPSAVAIIGATERPGSWGSFIMNGLLSVGFSGGIFPVNQRAKRIFGLASFPDVRAIPQPVELAVVTIPDDSLEEVIHGCGEKGVKGITIITAGFGEALPGGRERELEMARLARAYGMRIVGPNVSGTFNLHDRFNASPTPAENLMATPLAAVCQGGFAFYDLLASGRARAMGVGQFVHTGNECDLKVNDFLERFGKDPAVAGILMYLETLRDARTFFELAKQISESKPIIIHKTGRTSGGARAARSHTGAMAGLREVYQGAFDQSNVVLSPSMEMLLPLGHAFIERPAMRGDRVAIVTMGGSWGVAISDQLEEAGLRVPELSADVQLRLRKLGMPARASTRNPVDVGAAGPMVLSPETLIQIGRELLCSGEIDALVLHGFGRHGMVSDPLPEGARWFVETEKQIMRGYNALQQETGRPVIVGSCHLPWESQAVWDLNQEGVRIHHRIDEIVQILALMHRYWRKKGMADRSIA